MNVLFFSRLFYPHIGGVEKHVLEVSKLLIKKGHKITVVAERNSSDLKLRESIKGIKIFRIPNLNENRLKKFKIWKWLWENRKIIKDADIIHCHDVFFWYLPFKFFYFRKSVFTTFHGYEGNSPPSKKAIFMHRLAEIFSRGNICVGKYLTKWYGTRPNYITYGGVDERKDSINKFLSIGTKFKILFIGRLEKEAGIMEYLKAVKILKGKYYDIELTVLGDGSQRREAENFSNSNKLTVDFKGFVNDVSDYLTKTDLVFASRFLSTLESLNFKKLVFVIYNNDIKKDCFVMSPFVNFISLSKDEVSLSSSLTYYINNKNLMYNKVQNGYEWVKKQTWKKLEKIYLDLWKSNE